MSAVPPVLDAPRSRSGSDSTGRVRWSGDPVLLFSAFIVVHLVLGLINLYGPGFPLGDVSSVYKFWVDQAVTARFWVGIDSPWVYPIVAIVPMLAAYSLYPLAEAIPGSGITPASWSLYSSTWLGMILVLDLIALGLLTRWGRRRDRLAIGWWWTAFLIVLGPIAMGRIDSVSVPIAIVGVLLIAAHPRAATVVLTIAAWIKVWPGALVIALVVVCRDRLRVVLTAVAVSGGIAALALSFGAGWNVLSFVTEQTARGLQAEAPITTYWMWRAASGAPDTRVYFNTTLLTWQVDGPGAVQASELMTPLLVLVVIAVVLLALLVMRRGATAGAVLPPLVLALVTALIAFQKVGSPQFIAWLAVPVVAGLIMHRTGEAAPFRLPAALVLVIGALTQTIYPYLYGYLIGLWPGMLLVLTLRNALLFVLLGVAVSAISRAPAWPAARDNGASGRRIDTRRRTRGDDRAGGILDSAERQER